MEEVAELLRGVRITCLEKRLVTRALSKSFPGTPLRPRLPHSREPRRCKRCTYLVEYKLSKGQLREVEDFIDRGQKSLFLGVDLCEGRTKRLSSLSSMASMATTASANYGRPVTKGSRLVLQSGMLAVLGGGQDGRTGSEANREAKA